MVFFSAAREIKERGTRRQFQVFQPGARVNLARVVAAFSPGAATVLSPGGRQCLLFFLIGPQMSAR